MFAQRAHIDGAPSKASLTDTLEATLVRKWHQNPRLAHTGDTVGSHSGRVALIILHFWPDASADLLRAALYHDLAESIVGDLGPTAKALVPEHRAAEAAVAVKHGWHVDLSAQDRERLDLADKLDAYWWADWNHETVANSEWDAAAYSLAEMAERMGVRDKMRAVLGW